MDDDERIERRLKLRDLRVLMSVVETGSMSKAAERLGTSQPAVSRVIADLEHSLGVRLLDRGPRGIVSTPYGDVLIRRSIAAFDELKLGVKDIESLADPASGEVRISAPIILAAGFVAATVDRLARRYPRVVCHVNIDDGSQIYRRLDEREVDLQIAFVFAPLLEEGLDAQVLYTDPLVVVAATKNAWARRRKVRLADLMDEPWALPPPDSALGAACAEAFRAAGLDLPTATYLGAAGLARAALAARGRFLTITTASVLRGAAKEMGVKALPVSLQGPPIPVAIVTLKNRTQTAATQLFMDCARDVAKLLAKAKSRTSGPG